MIDSESVSDFDRRVNDNKTAAEEALRRIPAINRTIIEANEKTREAQQALGNAAADATEARNKAHEAERIASAVQKVCTPLLSETRPLLTCYLFSSCFPGSFQRAPPAPATEKSYTFFP